MKLLLLSEGFDIDDRGDKLRNAELADMISYLEEVFNENVTSRVSVLRNVLSDMKVAIGEIKITFGNEEYEEKKQVLSDITDTIELLSNLPDIPPPDDIIYYLRELLRSTHHYRTKYLHWSGKRFNER